MDKRRSWMAIVIQEGLQLGVLMPEDILRHATPRVLATDLPPNLVASLLQRGLDVGSFDPALLVEHLGAHKLAEHLPLPVLWGCLDEAAERSMNGSRALPPPVRHDVGEQVLDLHGAVLDEGGARHRGAGRVALHKRSPDLGDALRPAPQNLRGTAKRLALGLISGIG